MKEIYKASEWLKSILDFCPETKENQKLIEISNDRQGNLTIITRGETTSWKHTITSEEVILNET